MRLGKIGSVIFWSLACVLGGAGAAAIAVTCILVAMAVLSPAKAAGAPWPGPHPVEVLRVLDGDTVEVKFLSGPCGRGPCPGSVALIRVRGIDSPEVHLCRTGFKPGRGKSQSCAQCPEELRLGQEARAEADRLLGHGAAVRAREIGPDAYNGRFVARLEVISGGWQDYGAVMIAGGHAVRYDPAADKSFAKAKPWCAAEPAGNGNSEAAGGSEP